MSNTPAATSCKYRLIFGNREFLTNELSAIATPKPVVDYFNTLLKRSRVDFASYAGSALSAEKRDSQLFLLSHLLSIKVKKIHCKPNVAKLYVGIVKC